MALAMVLHFVWWLRPHTRSRFFFRSVLALSLSLLLSRSIQRFLFGSLRILQYGGFHKTNAII